MVGLAATIITDCLVPGCHLANLSRIGEIAQIGLARVNSPSLLLVCNPDIILKPRNSTNTRCQDLKLHIQFSFSSAIYIHAQSAINIIIVPNQR